METTTLSSKGQLVLPKRLRESRNWQPGTKFVIEEVDHALVLRPLKLFLPTRLEDVAGCLSYRGKPKTLQQMRDAIKAGVKGRSGRGRY